MKVKNWLCILSLVLSSCYSYQKIPSTTYDASIGEKVKLVTSHHEFKGRLLKKDNDTLVLQMKSGKTIQIAQNQVLEIKRAKFSILKTFAIPGGVLFGTYGIFQLSGGPNFDIETGL